MSGTEVGSDAELMMPSKQGSGWRPPREPSVPMVQERGRRDSQDPARWALGKLLRRKLEDD